MTSSMLTGERRRTSSRRGGLTSLGKVVVPKPINLPSQRLENHGLTRNVETVPNWGNRSSNSSSNPWGSTTPSPTADGGFASPSHLSGRPSSGGTGTRPSTAGSDKSHDPASSVWGPKSRPSSSSGALTSSQTSLVSLRPQSAEARPGSSQLSRFAESSDNTMAWSISGTAEKLGAPVSKNNGFSLFSGDFPTLGSGKDSDAKNTEQESDTHSRPGSSSSGVQRTKASIADGRSGNFNTWRKDDFPHDEFRPNVESWQGEPHLFHNANILPQPFAPWHTNPSPGGIWYRGLPSGPPPYGNPVGPGGFPIEYPYHHAQIPATAFPNTQGVVPPPGTFSPGMYRPHTANARIRPVMSNRPAFYPGPVPYEGYFGPPMGNRSSNERDIRFKGVAPGPGVYNGYPSQTVDRQMWEQAAPDSASLFEKWDQPRATPSENNWRPDHKKNEHLDSRRVAMGEEFSPQSIDKVNAFDELVVLEADIDVCASTENSDTPKDTTSHPKTEDLNAKACASDRNPAASETSFPRKTNLLSQGRVDHLVKGRLNAQEAEGGWHKKGLNSETTNILRQDRHNSAGFTEKSGFSLEGKEDPKDIQAQRARIREKAKQRAEQLQKEEEERTREQRAKCLAKLEELNRRSQAVQDSSQKLENVPPCEPIIAITMVEAPIPALITNNNVANHNSVTCSSAAAESTILSKELPIEASIDTDQLPMVIQNSSPLNDDVDSFDPAGIGLLSSEGSLSKKKDTSYKEMQKTPLENSPTENPASSITNEAPKINNESEMKVTPYTEVEIVSEVASSCEPSIHVLPNVLLEPSVHQKGKKYKSGRSRNEQEETPSVVIPENANTAKSSVDSGKQKPSEWDLDPNPVKPVTIIKDAVQSIESHGRVNNRWKSHNQRILPRSHQANRSVDTIKGNDAVVWAPVRLPNKKEMNDEPSNKNLLDQESTLTTRSDNPAQNNLKRAEMEGDITKPVAKVLPQQISIQQPKFLSSNKTLSDETVGRVQSENTQHSEIVIGKVVISTAPMNRNNKQIKTHDLWCLPGSTESTHVQVVQDGFSFFSKLNKSVQEPVEHNQVTKPDFHAVKVDQIKFSDGWNNSDEWDAPINLNSAEPVSSLVKDQRFRGKEKRLPFKGPVSTGSGNKDIVFSQSSVLDVNETDRTVTLKDNSVVAERSTSQWQPKSQTYSSRSQRGSRPSGSQNVTAEVRVKKESVPKDGDVPNVWHQDAKSEKKVHALKGRPYSPLSISEEISGGEAPSVGHHDSKWEKKVPSIKGRHTPNNGSHDLGNPPLNENFGSRHEQQRTYSGFHKNGNQNNRYGRGNEPRRDWNSSGQDNKQHHQPANQARQMHNTGSDDSSNKPNNFEGPVDGPSSKFRERGQHYPRRGSGNSYGRQSGTVRVDAAYD